MSFPTASTKVAYIPLNTSLTAPGDRRRFAGLARYCGIEKFDVDKDPKGFDLVVATLGSDLTRISAIRKANGALIFDMSDSYLNESTSNIRTQFRGIYNFARGKYSRPVLDFQSLLRESLSVADVVTCASDEQAASIQELNQQVFVIPDWLDEVEQPLPSRPPHTGTLELLWEGQPDNLRHLHEIIPQLNKLALTSNFKISFVTNGRYRPFGGSPITLETQNLLRKARFEYQVMEWTISNLQEVAKRSDLAIIPIKENDPFAWSKPENKLLSFWRLGVPVLASATPSYSRVMTGLGVEGIVSEKSKWFEYLANYDSLSGVLATQVLAGREYASERTSINTLGSAWHEAITHALS